MSDLTTHSLGLLANSVREHAAELRRRFEDMEFLELPCPSARLVDGRFVSVHYIKNGRIWATESSINNGVRPFDITPSLFTVESLADLAVQIEAQ